jgi:hypothetical protein
MRRQWWRLLVLLLRRRASVLRLAVGRRRRSSILRLSVRLLVGWLLWRRRALVVAVLRPARVVSGCSVSRAPFVLTAAAGSLQDILLLLRLGGYCDILGLGMPFCKVFSAECRSQALRAEGDREI